ncbi:MAG: TlpA family protein disulfide reductase [Oscillospiraceae bacterium]|jgi:thiol-disulfide isomerase/thioredoxin|nr:TlpA family protein disulfide reductase [Oscillospiraceae bacterium]
MNQRIKFILILLSLAAAITLAVFGYRALSGHYDEKTPPKAAAQEANPAADFTVVDADGNSVKLSDFFGKPIIINFWASWCGPCLSELPAFDLAYQSYGDEIVFLMVNLTDGYSETVSGVTAFVQENGYSFPVYFDTQYEGAESYNVSSIPLTVLIDKDGNLYQSHLGAMREETLRTYIGNLLGVSE